MIEPPKRCSKCGAEKPRTEFHARKAGKDGLRGTCKQCCSAYTEKYLSKNLERRKRLDAESYRRRKETPGFLEKQRAYARAYGKAYYLRPEVQARRKSKEEKEVRAARLRERNKSDEGKAANKRRWVQFKEKNAHQMKAHMAVRRALENGLLSKMPCAVCSTTDHVHAHHDDYSRPLDVMWLCRLHHAERHKKLQEASHAA